MNPCAHVIPASKLCRGAVYELSRQDLKGTQITALLRTWMGDRFPHKCEYRQVQAVIRQLTKGRTALLKKRKSSSRTKELEEFLSQPFTIPLYHAQQYANAMEMETETEEVNQSETPTCSMKIAAMEEEVARQHDEKKFLKAKHRSVKRNITKQLNRRDVAIRRKEQQLRQCTRQLHLCQRRSKRSAIIAKRRNQSLLLQIKQKHPKKVCVGTQTESVNPECAQCERYEGHVEKLLHADPGSFPMKVLHMRTGKEYSRDVVRCVLDLLQNNVGFEHVGPVIRAVLKLVNVVPDSVPTASGVQHMSKLTLPLVYANLSSTLAHEPNLTLYSDETRKHGQEYETYVVTTSQQEVKVLGVREMPDKSAETNMLTLQQVIDDLNRVPGLQLKLGNQIMSHIKNTMSDRAETEKAFQHLLRGYRANLLPTVIPKWNDLSEQQRIQMSEMHNFFCGLHLLVNAAEKAQQTLATFEAMQANQPVSHGKVSLSKTVELIRMACKAFARGGDEKNGCFSSVSIFLKSRGISTNLTRFRGNRFNILFHNASVLFFLQTHFLEFLETCFDEHNRLLLSVLDGLKNPVLIAACRALGTLNKFLTKPLWNVLESKGSILEMNSIYQQIIQNMKTCDPLDLLHGKIQLVPHSTPEQSSKLLTALTSPADNDAVAATIIQTLLTDISSLFQKILSDQLPGGHNFSKDNDTHPECTSALKHNKLPETIFAKLDYMQSSKPSISPHTIESRILYNFNKVGSWLDGLTDVQLADELYNASVLRRMTSGEFRQRHEAMLKVKLQRLEQKQIEVKQKREKALHQKSQLTDLIVIHGLWQNEAQVHTMLATYRTKKEKLDALKTQLKFRKNVLQQEVSDSSVFLFSKNRKPFSVEKLCENLISLISKAGHIVEGQPSVLIHQAVCHTFEVDGVDTDFKGKVISQVPGFPEWFNIVYDCQPETVYTYKLNEDLQRGWLKIVPMEEAPRNEGDADPGSESSDFAA